MVTSGFFSKTVDVSKRSFFIQMLKFDNGNFVSISEGKPNIGAMEVAIGIGPVPSTVSVIPAKTESLFLKLTSQKISSSTKGISIVTASINHELDSETAKALMKEIMEMVNQ